MECSCAVKLSKVADKYKIYDYPDIAERALGPTGKKIVRASLMLVHFQFLIGQVTFSMESL